MYMDSISSDINLGNEDQIEVEKPQEAITEPKIENIGEFLIDNDLEDYQLVRDIVKNEIKPPARYDEAYFASIFSVQNFLDNEPDSYEEAIDGNDVSLWLVAMKNEMLSLVKNKIWVLVNKSNRQKIIDYKWIYKIKDEESKDNSLMYEAQLVAKDFTQREGIDYNEIFTISCFTI